MRIFVGLTLLAVALAIHIHPSETEGGEKVDLLDATEIIVYAFQYYHDLPRDGIVSDYFGRGFHLESGTMSRELFDELKMWGQRWNLEMIKDLEYDDATQSIIIPKDRATTPATESTYKDANDERVQYLIRAVFKAFGIEDESIRIFFARNLHVPLTMDRYSELIRWGHGYGVENLDKAAESVYREEMGREKERQWKVEATDAETPPVYQEDLKAKLVRAQVVRDLAGIVAHIREWALGAISHKDSNESFNNLTEYEHQLIAKVYIGVYVNVTKQFGPNEDEEVRNWCIREIYDLFSHINQYTRRLQGAIANGEIHIEDISVVKSAYNDLTEYEKKVADGVYFDLERKITKQLGFANDRKEEDNIAY